MAEEPQLIQAQPVMIHPKQMAILRNCMQAKLGCTKLTRKGFVRKNIVAVSFFSKLYTNILNTYLNFKHEHLYLYMFSENSLSLYHYIWSDEFTC